MLLSMKGTTEEGEKLGSRRTFHVINPLIDGTFARPTMQFCMLRSAAHHLYFHRMGSTRRRKIGDFSGIFVGKLHFLRLDEGFWKPNRTRSHLKTKTRPHHGSEESQGTSRTIYFVELVRQKSEKFQHASMIFVGEIAAWSRVWIRFPPLMPPTFK